MMKQIIKDNKIKLIICQKVFDYQFRWELYEEFSVSVYDQVSMHYINQFKDALNTLQVLETITSLKHFDVSK